MRTLSWCFASHKRRQLLAITSPTTVELLYSWALLKELPATPPTFAASSHRSFKSYQHHLLHFPRRTIFARIPQQLRWCHHCRVVPGRICGRYVASGRRHNGQRGNGERTKIALDSHGFHGLQPGLEARQARGGRGAGNAVFVRLAR